MATLVQITSTQGVVLTGLIGSVSPGAATKQPLYQALDASGIDMLDLQVGFLGATSILGAPTVIIDLLSSMQKDSDDTSWMSLTGGVGVASLSGAMLTGGPLFFKQSFLTESSAAGASAGLLRYLRWAVIVIGASTNIGSLGFWMAGMGRRTG